MRQTLLRPVLVVIVATLFAASVQSARATTLKGYITLSPPGSVETLPQSVNNTGAVVGWYSDGSTTHGFLYFQGNYTTLNYPGADGTVAQGINDNGQIVGYYNVIGGGVHGFTYSNGNYTSYDYPDPNLTATYLNDISNSGQLVGTFTTYNPQTGTSGGSLFVDSGGAYRSISPFGYQTWLAGSNYHINATGQIAGSYIVPTGNNPPSTTQVDHGFVDTAAADAMVDFPGAVTDNPWGIFSGTDVYGINDTGDVVGFYSQGGSNATGFVYHAGTGTFDSLILSGAVANYWLPTDLNNSDQIIGNYEAVKGGTIYGFLTPEPGSFSLLALCGLAALRRRRRVC